MKLIFNKPGEYKNGRFVTKVTEENVKAKKIFIVNDANAIIYVDAKYAKRFKEPIPETPKTLEDIKEMSAPELKAYAAKMEIDLDGKTKKDDVFEIIEKTFK